MKFKRNKQEAETETEQKRRINTVKIVLEHGFGSDNVKYNESTGFYEVTVQSQAVAISSEKLDWKFLVIKNEQKPFLHRLLPKKLADEFQ